MLPNNGPDTGTGDCVSIDRLLAPRKRSSGSAHLTKRSNLTRGRRGWPREILIVDDDVVEAQRLTATLHVLFGYQVPIRWVRSIAEAIAGLAERHPSVTFLDDILDSSNDVLHAIPTLRGAGYDGPIIVISGSVTRSRRARLMASGAADVIHRDEVDSVRIAEAWDRARGAKPERRRD